MKNTYFYRTRCETRRCARRSWSMTFEYLRDAKRLTPLGRLRNGNGNGEATRWANSVS